MNLPPCPARVEFEPDQRRYRCAHPKVHAIDDIVTPNVCLACGQRDRPVGQLRVLKPIEANRNRPEIARAPSRDGLCFHMGGLERTETCESCKGNVQIKVYSCEHSMHDETTIAGCKLCYDHEPVLRRGGVRRWAVGVVTAPREQPTLERTLTSLSQAGWDRARLFVEPGSPLPVIAASYAKTVRDERLGAWPNWWLGLVELMQRDPDADAYVMLEDDVDLRPGLRQWLENELWPEAKVGVVSLFCAARFGGPESGWRKIDAGWSFAGAQALVFPPAAARRFVAHPTPMNHRRTGRDQGQRDTDGIVGLWAQREGLPLYVFRPSLADHVGEHSTLGHGPLEGRGRTAWQCSKEPIS